MTLDIRPPNDYRRVCAFCGACDETSRERVFPQWMADLLRGDQPGQFQMARHPHRATPTTWQTVKPDTKAPIGKRCNSEWMSDLEPQHRPTSKSSCGATGHASHCRWLRKTGLRRRHQHRRRR